MSAPGHQRVLADDRSKATQALMLACLLNRVVGNDVQHRMNCGAGVSRSSRRSCNGQRSRRSSPAALSADGSTLAAGAHLEDNAETATAGTGADNSATDSGAVYIF